MTTKSKDDAPAPVESMLEGPDPFDPATHKKRVRTAAVRTVQTAVSVKKPSKQTFVRAHTEELFHIRNATEVASVARRMRLVTAASADSAVQPSMNGSSGPPTPPIWIR